MTKEISKFLKKQMGGVKDLATDLIPRFATLLDPQVWQNPETIKAGLINVATGFVASRIGGMLKDISIDENVDEAVLENQKSKQVLLELAKFAANENPDPEVWDAAKKIFIRTLKKEATEQERTSLYGYLDLCRELSGAEIMILASAYIVYQKVENFEYPKEFRQHHTRRRWAQEIASLIGYKTEEEVLRHEESLAKHKLIYPTEVFNGNERGDWNAPGYAHRLTPLGINFSKALASN